MVYYRAIIFSTEVHLYEKAREKNQVTTVYILKFMDIFHFISRAEFVCVES